MFPIRSRVVGLCMAVLPGLLLGGCSTRSLILRHVGDELAQQAHAQNGEDDLVLAREASAFYLKLSESILRPQPGHLALAESVASGFTQYAYAFVSFEADRREASDARAAQALRERAARLYARAWRHARTALEADQPGFMAALSQTDPARWPPLRPETVGLAYWGAAAWAGQISLSKDHPDTVADLPLSIRLAERAYACAPGHGDGALASLMGTLEMARPGGSTARALAYFDEAIRLGQDHQAGALVAKAEGWAQTTGDKTVFALLLGEALSVSARHPTLPNEAARLRAQWLLAQIDDLF
ncbi:TRAP transporter TatT component family protein [Sphaerotilus sp.]|uniref:TRAP transporter TatT component family protein n=1 Tax=Sphaerotilus sp. TaxID=2093942 RepID=UPI0034E1ACA1